MPTPREPYIRHVPVAVQQGLHVSRRLKIVDYLATWGLRLYASPIFWQPPGQHAWLRRHRSDAPEPELGAEADFTAFQERLRSVAWD